MGWIVLTFVMGIVFWGAVAFAAVARVASKDESRPQSQQGAKVVSRWGWGVAALAAVIWVGISLSMMFHTVGQREVAIVYNFSGTIAGKKDPGVITTMPWQHVKKENVGILHDEWKFDTSNSAVSRDQQPITSVISVNYQIDAANVVDLYKRVGSAWKNIIIDARVPQVFKETTATFTTPELTQKREQLRIATKERLTEELSPYDIKVVDVFIRNLGFSQSYTDSIERKQKQVQDALTAKAKVDQITAEADQKVAQAKGERDANVIRAQGEAQANRLRRQTLTPLLVQQQAIEKLNDKVQVIVCPPASVCVPNAGAFPLATGNGGG